MLEERAAYNLPNYYKILEKKAMPLYLKCKKVPIEIELTENEKNLWEVHDKTVEKVRKISSRDENEILSLLDLKLELARLIIAECSLCERKCKVARTDGKKGHCKVLESKIASEFLHWGEEPELIPSYTIFFSGCTFNCVFCQNWDISQSTMSGTYIEPKIVAEMIERRSARNVNWVGGEPTPNLAYILQVLKYCNANLPQVWNSNMYMSLETMRLLDGVIDLYLSDFKYGNDKCAERLSNVKNYFEIVARNHKIANAQTEMIIRHLVLPNHGECCSKPVLNWITENLDLNRVRVNVMAQYRPEYKAYKYEDLSRGLKSSEFLEAYKYAGELGLNLVE